jgi:hypothetical protein
MDERPDQIIGHIEAQRDELGRNLNELETRVRKSTDWRTYYDRNPMLMMGAALGGGLLLGSMVGSKSSGSGFRRSHGRRSRSSSALGLASAGVGASAAATWSQPSTESHSSRSSRSSLTSSPQWQQVSQTMDHIKDALIAFGMAKAKEFLRQAVPGIDQHLSDAERKHQEHGHQQSWQQHGSTGEAQSFADHGAFAQDGGAQPSNANWEPDIYGASGQQSGQGTKHGQGGGDYYSGSRAGEQTGEHVPVNQY